MLPNINGNICYASVRYAKTNNKLMGSLYIPKKSISYIAKMNANNIYSWAMSQTMSYKELELMI